MPAYSISTDTVATTVNQLLTRIEDLQVALKGIEQEKDAIVASFQGDAQVSFDDVNGRWIIAQQQIQRALDGLRGLADHSKVSYMTTDAAGADAFRRVN